MNYLRTAFSTRWNLLFFGAGVAAAFISGVPGVVLPLVAAGEIFYLASMVTNDRFRSAVEAQAAKVKREAEAVNSRQAYERIRKRLPPRLVARFDQLRDHCQKLVELAGSMRGPDGTGPDGYALESLDRLLWGYLRMIWGAATLNEFLNHTDEGQIRAAVADLERRLSRLPEGGDEETKQLRSALEDHVKTSRERIANIEDAHRKLQVVEAEIQRLESKIAALAEGSVAKRDVKDIATRVDEVAEGMKRTDETMRQLQLPPELEELDAPPQIVREKA
jgi:methyl-accepting chemotaxis protein